MATIDAKKNIYDTIWNPLDPDNWVGGVVPGPSDIARFHNYETNTTYENNYYYLSNSYLFGQNFYNMGGTMLASHWNHTHNGKSGYFSSSFWSQDYRMEYVPSTWRTSSLGGGYDPTRYNTPAGFDGQNWKYGSNMNYGSDGPYNKESSSMYWHFGLTPNQYNLNNYSGNRKVYNTYTENYHNSHRHNVIRADYPNYNKRYYQFYTKMFRVDGVGSTVSLTVDGVTIAEEDIETYNVTGQRLGHPIADATASMAKRMVDLFEASSLHINNGGKWKVWGPHNLRGWYTNTELNLCNGFTIAMETGSDWSSGPSISDTNLSYISYDNVTRGMWGYSMFTGSVYDLEFPAYVFAENRADGLIQEGTSSMRWSTRFGNGPAEDYSTSNLATYNLNNPHSGYSFSQYMTGSGYFEMMPNAYHWFQGFGPGNIGRLKIRFDDTRYAYNINSAYHDTTFASYVTESKVQHPIFPNVNTHISESNPTGCPAGGYANGPLYIKQSMLQRWELTGSQVWQVGRIEMGKFTHFHQKDQSKIILHDMQGSSNGTNQSLAPTIEWETNGEKATWLMTDETSIEISSSRTNYWDNDEPGMYQRRSQTSLIISGSANYSSSKISSPSTAGDTTLNITNASDHFAVGDIVSVQSTGSFEFIVAGGKDPIIDNPQGINSSSIDINDSGSWYSGSYEELILRHSSNYDSYTYNSSGPAFGETFTAGQGFEQPIMRSYTHAVDTDELVYIEATSSNTITPRKFYGKEGEIQSDMGLYSRNSFISTFTSGGLPENYNGTKRVVLVDSNHKKFKKGDNLVISGSVYKVLHNTTYLSQSKYVDFSRDDNGPLDQILNINLAMFSASSIWPIPTDSDGTRASNISTYFFESLFTSYFAITGSYQGTNEIIEKYGHLGVSYLHRSGSSNGYRALRLDPTLTHNWYNKATNGYDTHSSYDASRRYQYHNNHTTMYLGGTYQLLGTDNFEDGEITVSGSLLRDGYYDPTSSVGYWAGSGFGASYGYSPYSGGPMNRYDYDGVDRGMASTDYPYTDGHSISSRYHGMLLRVNGYRGHNVALSKWPDMRYQSNNPGQPLRYFRRMPGKSIEEDPNSGNWSISSWNNDYTSSYYKNTGSLEAKRATHPDKFAGSGTLRLVVDDHHLQTYVDDGNGNELLLDEGYTRQGRGRVGLRLHNYGSIHSVNVKIKWQQLILDTQDSFNYKDQIYESNLLYDHYAGKDVNHIATVVKDPKGFKNLLWEYMRTKGDTNILPYLYALCDSGTTAGSTSTNFAATRFWYHIIRNNYSAIIPKNNVGNYYISNYQANDNFYVIYDLNTQVTFDTIGMIFCKDAYGFENVTNNQMNNVHFQVCDDVGVAAPNWIDVRAKANDIRYSTRRGSIRFYTFPSGSVNKRFIKYHSRGGTNSTAFAMHSFFGIYNFSGSCADSNTLDANAVAGGFADQFGSPTASMCQVELASTKNWKVGDMIYFWSKQMMSSNTFGSEMYQNTNSYYDTPYVTGINGDSNTATTTEAQLVGGKWPVHTITNIQGNIVTLDKPITHTHVDAGTLAYKYNRGNITLKSENPAILFNIGWDQNMSKRTTVRNITGINAYMSRYNNTYRAMHTLEDAGVLPYRGYAPNGSYMPPGLYRNIITTNWHSYGSDYHWTGWQNCKQYNIQNDYSHHTHGGPVGYLGAQPGNTINFCRSSQQTGYNPRILKGYSSGRIGMRGDVYYQNNYVPDDQHSTHFFPLLQDGASGDNYDSVIHIGENIVSDHLGAGVRGAGYADRTFNGYNSNRNNSTINLDYKIAFRRTFWNPYIGNPKHEPYHYSDISGYSAVPVNNTTTNRGIGQQPMYQSVDQQRYFHNRDVLYRERNYSYATLHYADTEDPTINNVAYVGSVYPDMTYSSGHGTKASIWGLEFIVKETTDIRLDISMYYRIPFSGVYTYGRTYADSQNNNSWGNNIPYILVHRLSDSKIIYKKKLYDTAYTNLNIQEIMQLTPDIYKVDLIWRSLYQHGMFQTIIKYKDLKCNIVTTDTSKIDIVWNDWDEDIGMKSNNSAVHRNNHKSYPGTENNGINAVLKQSNDLSGTKNIKFNKIKL